MADIARGIETASDRIEVKNTTCYMCACRCGIRVTLKNGEVRYIQGNPDHPLNHGVICAKGSSGIMKQFILSLINESARSFYARVFLETGKDGHVQNQTTASAQVWRKAGRSGRGCKSGIVQCDRSQLISLAPFSIFVFVIRKSAQARFAK